MTDCFISGRYHYGNWQQTNRDVRGAGTKKNGAQGPLKAPGRGRGKSPLVSGEGNLLFA